LTARYPAQLHINVDEDWRGRGIGAGLVTAFLDLAGDTGAEGVHAISTRGMRNVGFYLANGFEERGATTINGRELVFLGRDV
jgi:GNAT superfamily N-acetyltransferase